nr:MAG TPA: hypothetical protein [Caudoviricetes sp.]
MSTSNEFSKIRRISHSLYIVFHFWCNTIEVRMFVIVLFVRIIPFC